MVISIVKIINLTAGKIFYLIIILYKNIVSDNYEDVLPPYLHLSEEKLNSFGRIWECRPNFQIFDNYDELEQLKTNIPLEKPIGKDFLYS